MFGQLSLIFVYLIVLTASIAVSALSPMPFGREEHQDHNQRSVHAHHRSKRSGCEATRACLTPFPMLVDLVEKDSAGALATLTYEVLLNHTCSQREQLRQCLSSTSCNVFEQSFTGPAIQDSLDFICEQGRSVLLNESGCFSRDDFEAGIYQCSQIMHVETNVASVQMQVNLADTTAFCTVFDNLLKCVHLNVERVCSTMAADFASKLYGITIQRLANQIGCTIQFD